AEMQNETQKEIAGIQSATSRQNTKDQVYAQNEMLAYQQKESTARVASIMENTNLSKQQQVSEIMRQMLTQAQTAGQYFTNDQIKEMTRKVSAEVVLVHQQTQNQRYGSSHIGATAMDISNVVTDAASGVVDIFHGIDKSVADTWNNFWKDSKANRKASLRQNCVTIFSFSKNHFSSPSGQWSIVLLISSWDSTLWHCANSSINFSVTDTNSSRTSEAALWPSRSEERRVGNEYSSHSTR